MPMRQLLTAVLLLGLGSWALQVRAEAPAVAADTPASPAEAPSYSATGADTCLKCHGDEAPVMAIFKTRHAVAADARTPFAKLQCESCHGPGGEHSKKLHPGDPRPPIALFGANAKATPAELNGKCLSCHQDSHGVGWQGSVHERDGVTCVSCHRVHAEHDPVTQISQQPGVCYQCHRDVRLDFEKFSAHPVRDGNMSCTSCHAPHDSLYPALLKHPTVNQTCESCHAQVRGPFLWEHPPVAEDCGNCHRPHGSANPTLLTVRPPLLCQQCHSAADHPSLALTGQDLPGNSPSAFVLAGSCMNCHSQVHGSNAPSGALLNR